MVLMKKIRRNCCIVKDDERVLIPNYIALGGWVFFALKVLFALTGFVMVFVNLLMLF